MVQECKTVPTCLLSFTLRQTQSRNLLIYGTESQQDRCALNYIYKARKLTESYYKEIFYITKFLPSIQNHTKPTTNQTNKLKQTTKHTQTSEYKQIFIYSKSTCKHFGCPMIKLSHQAL